MPELVSKVDVKLINVSASDDMVALAAWVSHDTDNDERLKDTVRRDKLINFLYRSKHMSPFEHGVFTFKVDVPLFVAREFQRHRTASYNEVSGRYTEMRPRFWAGDTARTQHGKPGDYTFEPATNEQTAIYKKTKDQATEYAWNIYQQRLDAGIAKEQAREDLPLSLMTQFYVTMNPRNLMQFLALRNDKHALKEIREVAVLMEEIFAEHMPVTCKAFRAERYKPNYKDLHEGLTAEYKALAARYQSLEHNFNSMKAARGSSFDAMVKAQKERDEAIATRDEAVEKFNGFYVSTVEAQNEENKQRFNAAKERAEKRLAEEDPKPDLIDSLLDKSVETLAPNFGKLAESAAPIYNIYLDVKHGDLKPEDVANRVISELKKVERRRKNENRR